MIFLLENAIIKKIFSFFAQEDIPMKKKHYAVAVIISAALLLSACNSNESPSELDNLIDSLQTSHLPPETEPEETGDTEETEDTAGITEPDDGPTDVVYGSLTGTVLAVEENLFSVESNGIRYVLVSENIEIFGGTLSEGKTVTVTYTSSEGSDNITVIAITVLQEESTEQE